MAVRTITVNNAAQLNVALKGSTGGETIVLNTVPGVDYGDVRVTSLKPTSDVTITSAPGAQAVLKSLSIQWSDNINVDNVEISHTVNAAGMSSSALYIQGSNHIDITNSFIHGSLNGNSWDDGRGARVITSKDVQLHNNTMTEFWTTLSLEKSAGVAVTQNTMFEMREGINILADSHILIDHNLIHTIKPNTAKGDHADAIQVFTGATYDASNDLTFSNNAILKGGGEYAQGIFIQSERMAEGIHHSNIRIENNLYSGSSMHGIFLSGVDGAIVDNNTIIASPNWVNEASICVKYSSRVAVLDNIADHYNIDKTATETLQLNNIHAVTKTVGVPGGPIPVTDLLTNPMNDRSIDPHDFAVRPDALGTTFGAGFDIAQYDAPKSFQSVDTLMLAVFNGGVLHHIV